jgi:hypothetical protein
MTDCVCVCVCLHIYPNVVRLSFGLFVRLSVYLAITADSGALVLLLAFVATLLSHYCYIVVTLFLHCCYNVVTLLSHCCYSVVALSSSLTCGLYL